jgi:hypothetical protein
MANNYTSDNQYKYYGPGSRPSEQVLKCYTCRNRGWPHEPIILAKAVSGGYLKLDYMSGKPHIHKDIKHHEEEKPAEVQQTSEPAEQPQKLLYDHTKFNEAIEILIKLFDKWEETKK